MDLAILNASTFVSEDQARAIAAALDAQLREDVLPDWDRRPCRTFWMPGGTGRAIPPGVLPIYLFDAPDSPGVYGYHDETPEGFLSGKVFCGPVLDAGGGVLDAGRVGDSVSAVASHEGIEAKFDPNVNLWADHPRGIYVGGKRFASASRELCDPAQAGTYSKPLPAGSAGWWPGAPTAGVLVSNYVLPAWFDPGNSAGPFDRLRTIEASFSLAPGGYVIVRDAAGNESSEFGPEGDARPWRASARRVARLASSARARAAAGASG